MRLIKPAQAYFVRAPVQAALAAALCMRAVWLALALPGLLAQVHMERFVHVDARGLGYMHTPVQLVDIWARWDAMFYMQIAERGYACPPDFACTAFFPLFSLVIRALHTETGASVLACGLGVANAADMAGWALVAVWLQRRLEAPKAFWAFVAFVLFPTRNFGFSLYTEGLFLTLSVGAYLAYETRRYGVCGALCALASASRPQGVLVGFALGVDGVWARLRQKSHAPPGAGLAALCTAPAGLAAYMGYLYMRWGDGLMFLHAQQVWHRQMQAPWRIIGVHAEPIEYVVLSAAIVLCVLGLVRRAPLRETVYVAMSLLVPMSTGRFTSINRFTGVLFPLFAFGMLLPPKRRFVWTYAAVCAVYTVVFAFKLGQGAKVI